MAFFDAWYDAPPTMGVRLFQEIMHALLGGASTSEAVGLSTPESIVVETDGSRRRAEQSHAYMVRNGHGPVHVGNYILIRAVSDLVTTPWHL